MAPIMLSTGEFLGVLNLAGAALVCGVSVSATIRRKGINK